MVEDFNTYQTQFYTNLRVGWIKQGEQISFILNPFNFTFYGSVEGNLLANKIIQALVEVFDGYPLTYETLVEADKWVEQYLQKYL